MKKFILLALTVIPFSVDANKYFSAHSYQAAKTDATPQTLFFLINAEKERFTRLKKELNELLTQAKTEIKKLNGAVTTDEDIYQLQRMQWDFSKKTKLLPEYHRAAEKLIERAAHLPSQGVVFNSKDWDTLTQYLDNVNKQPHIISQFESQNSWLMGLVNDFKEKLSTAREENHPLSAKKGTPAFTTEAMSRFRMFRQQ